MADFAGSCKADSSTEAGGRRTAAEAARRQRASAVVIAPAHLGEGGLGRAAQDYVDGLGAEAVEVTFAGRAAAPTPLERFAALPLVGRSRGLSTYAARTVLLRHAPSGDLIVAPPSFLPEGDGFLALHQATWHPETVRQRSSAAQREAGGGAGFLPRGEAYRQVRELERADVVRAESQAVADDLSARGVSGDKIVVCPPGIDLDRFRPGIQADPLTVAFVGALSLWKGVHRLAALSHALPSDVVLEVIGGPVCPWSRRLVERSPFIRSARTVPELLSRADFLVLPSVTDGFGYVVLEAMASGAVPIVTPAVGAAELVMEIDPALVVDDDGWPRDVLDLIDRGASDAWIVRARKLAEKFERIACATTSVRSILHRM